MIVLSVARADEVDICLSGKVTWSHLDLLTIRPCPGNGAVITTNVKGPIRLTTEQRKQVAMALWPDAFTEDVQ